MAGNSDTRQLQLQISASTELLIRNLKQADNAVAAFQQSTDRRLSSIDARFDAVGALRGKLAGLDTKIGIGDLASAATGITLVELARRGLDYASSLGEIAQQLGVTTRDLQIYGYAASQAGIDQETMEKSLAKLTVTLGKAQLGAEKPVKAFNALGISLADLDGKTAGEVIPLIAEGLKRIADPARRAAIEVELFGKTGQKLDTLLAGGRSQIDELADAAQRLGLVLSDEQIQSADEAADKLAEVKQVLEANVARVVADNAGAITAFANAIGDLTGAIIRFSGSNPEYVLGLLGGFAGSRLGPVGAGLGAAAGYLGGKKIGEQRDDASTDLAFRRRELAKAEREAAKLRRIEATGDDPDRLDSGSAGGLLIVRRKASARSGGTFASAMKEVERQKTLLAAAEKAVSAPKSKPASIDIAVDRIFDGGGKKGGTGKSAAQLAREADAAAKRSRQQQGRAEDLLARADLDVLSARADLSIDPEQRLSIEQQRIDLAKAARDTDLEEQAIDNRFVAANLDRLKVANALVAALDKDLAAQRVAQENEQAENDRRRARVDDAIALDEIAASLTVVNRERYAIERRILAAKQQEERETLERIKANVAGRFSPQDVTTASEALDRLPQRQQAERAALADRQQGPIARYRDQLRSVSEDTSEALETIAVRGFGQLEDAGASAIASSVTNLLKLKGVAGSVVGSIIADLARLAIQKAIVSAIGGSFFGLAGGGSLADIPGRAAGGSLGGLISGPGTGTSDSILALLSGPGGAVRLSNREFIMNAGAVDFYGADAMAAINARRLPRFATGGSIGGPRLPSLAAPRIPDLRGAGDRSQRLAVDVNATIDASPEFDVRMHNVAVRTVGAAAEPIMAGATATTIRKLKRVGLPGGWG